jgi:glycolate oxidase FAD binding subunit
VWNERPNLWEWKTPFVVCKFTLPPARVELFLKHVGKAAAEGDLSWRLIAQAVGVGLLQLRGGDNSVLLNSFLELRKGLESQGSSLVILHSPLDLKSKTDVWGSPGDALQLMRRIKAQFDPTGTLNPGRFVGGI